MSRIGREGRNKGDHGRWGSGVRTQSVRTGPPDVVGGLPRGTKIVGWESRGRSVVGLVVRSLWPNEDGRESFFGSEKDHRLSWTVEDLGRTERFRYRLERGTEFRRDTGVPWTYTTRKRTWRSGRRTYRLRKRTESGGEISSRRGEGVIKKVTCTVDVCSWRLEGFVL